MNDRKTGPSLLRIERRQAGIAYHERHGLFGPLIRWKALLYSKLIAVKARQGGGSAFRPGREADMMRVIADDERGAEDCRNRGLTILAPRQYSHRSR